MTASAASLRVRAAPADDSRLAATVTLSFGDPFEFVQLAVLQLVVTD